MTWDIVTFTLGLVFLAELGDKSQLVCMTLASRYSARMVFVATSIAFALLNGVAVVFGAVLTNWLPDWLIALAVMLLFLIFGVQALRAVDDDDAAPTSRVQPKYLIPSIILLLFMAEFGDKTQLMVVALGSSHDALSVWFGATMALLANSALACFVGKKLLCRLPQQRIHQICGVSMLMMSAWAGYELIQL